MGNVHRLVAGCALGAALAATGAVLATSRRPPPPRIVADALVVPPASVTIVEQDDPPPADVPFGPPRPPRRVLLTRPRVTPAITRTALEVLDRPFGSEVVRTLEDKTYAFVVEHHYHSPDSGMKPVGWHKGVTVYALEE